MNTNDNLSHKKKHWSRCTSENGTTHQSCPGAGHTNIYLVCVLCSMDNVGMAHDDSPLRGKSVACPSEPARRHRSSALVHRPSVHSRIHQPGQGVQRTSCTVQHARSRDLRSQNCSKLRAISGEQGKEGEIKHTMTSVESESTVVGDEP